MASKTGLTKREDDKLANLSQVPDYLRKAQGEEVSGLENVDRADMTLPRLQLCQSMTPQRKKSDAKYIEGLSEGDFFNSVTSQNYGNKVKIVPLLFYKSRARFKPMEEGGGLLCQAADGLHGTGDPGGDCLKCPMAEFQGSDRPECDHFFNYAVLVLPEKGSLGLDGLAALSLKSTGLRTAKDFNALMRLRGTDSFAGIYEVTSAEAKNQVGQWYSPVIKPAGWVTKEDYDLAKSCYEGVREMKKQGKLKVDEEFPPEESSREPGE